MAAFQSVFETSRSRRFDHAGHFAAFPTYFGWGTASSPVIDGKYVFLQLDNDKASSVLALDMETGQTVWKADRDENSTWSSPYIWKNSKRVELVTAAGKKMRSYSLDDGKVLSDFCFLLFTAAFTSKNAKSICYFREINENTRVC